MRWIFLLFLVMASDETCIYDTYYVDEQLVGFVRNWNKKAERLGLTTNINKITWIGFGRDLGDQRYVGVCEVYPDGTRQIVISHMLESNVNGYFLGDLNPIEHLERLYAGIPVELSQGYDLVYPLPDFLFVVMMHEMGHCALDKVHVDNKMEIMNPIIDHDFVYGGYDILKPAVDNYWSFRDMINNRILP